MEYEKTKALLAINDTNAKDSGEYTCMAENDLGMQTSSFYMHVRGKLFRKQDIIKCKSENWFNHGIHSFF